MGLAANFFSPKGLGLGRNYFPKELSLQATLAGVTANSVSQLHQPASNAAQNSTSNAPDQNHLNLDELQMVDGVKAWKLFNDRRYQEHVIVFVDARDDQHYAEGHIPGAYQFDHYHPEKYLLNILSICQTAEEVIVYCNGGDCEDSKFSVITLKDAGVPNQKLFVYRGGIAEWKENQHPVSTGDQP